MAKQQTITKTGVEFDEIRLQKRTRLDENGQPVITAWAVVGYKVTTDSPDDDYVRLFEAGPLAGQNLATVTDIYTRIMAAIKAEEGIV